MIEQTLLDVAPASSTLGAAHLRIYGHFYQPPREEPFSGLMPSEPGAAPYDNFNEKITAECYRPNAMAGNFDEISFHLGPTLAVSLEPHHPDGHQRYIPSHPRP